jgi:hypothetical protein
MISLDDIYQTDYLKYYKIHDKERKLWYYSEWFLGVLVKWALDIDGYTYEKWR